MNPSQAGCVRWLRAHLELPDAFIAMLGEAAHSTRIEQQERALVAVFNDVIFDFERTPAQVATLWVCARRKLLVTLRHAVALAGPAARACAPGRALPFSGRACWRT